MAEPTEEQIAQVAGKHIQEQQTQLGNAAYFMAIVQVLTRAGLTTDAEFAALVARARAGLEQEMEARARENVRELFKDNPGLVLMAQLMGSFK